jgi:hypothetical protein
MNVLTIPKNLIKNDDLVIIPRKEYKEFLNFRIGRMKEMGLTTAQKNILTKARKNLSQGKFLTINELKQKLGVAN